MNMRRSLIACCMALLAASPAAGQIYSYVDASGQTVFTDRPPAATESNTVELQQTNRMPAGQRMVKLQAPAELKQQLTPPPPAYQELQLLSPQADETLRNTGRSIAISVNSTPALLPGHSYQARLDGSVYGPASRSTQWRLEEIDRGSHQLQVHIVDTNGNSLLQTPDITLHIHQTSLAERRRIQPCTPNDYGQRPECPLSDKPSVERPWWRFGL